MAAGVPLICWPTQSLYRIRRAVKDKAVAVAVSCIDQWFCTLFVLVLTAAASVSPRLRRRRLTGSTSVDDKVRTA